jgi:hypothetical protein
MLDVAVQEKSREKTLTAKDRCDACGSQAYVHVFGSTGDLMFCAHHFNKISNNPESKMSLTAFAYKIVDERDFL